MKTAMCLVFLCAAICGCSDTKKLSDQLAAQEKRITQLEQRDEVEKYIHSTILARLDQDANDILNVQTNQIVWAQHIRTVQLDLESALAVQSQLVDVVSNHLAAPVRKTSVK